MERGNKEIKCMSKEANKQINKIKEYAKRWKG